MTHETTVPAYHIFNPNNWDGLSRSIVASCAAQFGLLQYAASCVPQVVSDCDDLCYARFSDLQEQWARSPWELRRGTYWVEVPEFHLYTQAYLSTVKTLLDLLAQLVTTEELVNKKVHGFHKKGQECGGQLLHILNTKALPTKGKVASHLCGLIEEHKRIWIDRAIDLRDTLIHLEKGLSQIMFALDVEVDRENLRLAGILHPQIGGQGLEEYAEQTTQHISRFCTEFLDGLKAS